MKKNKIIFLCLVLIIFVVDTFGQDADVTIAVAPSNAGIVAVDAVIDLTVTVSNTLSTGSIAAAKLRPTVALPSSTTFLATASQTSLPTGWTILTNNGSQIRFCNTSAVIPPLGSFDVILKVRGVTVAPPSQTLANIFFGNGTTCASGPAIQGDDPSNNSAGSTIQVIPAVVPLNLTSFTGIFKNCTPSLTWITENEVNTKSFEIEKSTTNANDWRKVGTVTANGNSSTKLTYTFNDFDAKTSIDKLFYRLKMIDLDGRFTYSAILPLNGECKEATLNVYPNPIVEHKLFVNLTGMNAAGNASLITLTGQVVFTAKVNNGNNSLVINNVVDGIYILNVKDAFGFDKNIKVSVKN